MFNRSFKLIIFVTVILGLEGSAALAEQFTCQNENLTVTIDTITESVDIDDGTSDHATFTVSEFRKYRPGPFNFQVFGNAKVHLYDWRNILTLHDDKAYFTARTTYYGDTEQLHLDLFVYDEYSSGYSIIPRFSTSTCHQL